jgi:GNAT superfamily N-acetyltransferase
MATKLPGETVGYTITYLEMTERPEGAVPPMPGGASLALLAAHAPPVEYFLYLYRAVGRDYEWTDWLAQPRADQEAFLTDPQVELFTLMVNGWPGGFFVLDTREYGTCDIAYFGLVPQAIGRGLSPWFLGNAIRIGWDRPDVQRLTVNTNTLDHPRALSLYQRMGFTPARREESSRVLTLPRKM